MSTVFPPFEPDREEGKRKYRPLGFGRGQVPVRVLIPNIFTLLGLCAGLTVIRMAIEQRWDIAVAALVFAAILDGLDGRIARLLKASSRFGAELDSLADFVNFGVAPAIVIFIWALGDLRSLGWIVVLAFAICAALRLARFNVALDRPDTPDWHRNYFVGVPAPAGAIVLLLPLYLRDLGVVSLSDYPPVVLAYTLAIAFLMVSRVPTFSAKKLGQRIPREHVPPIFILAALFMAILLTYPAMTLAVGSILYLLMIPYSALRFHRREREDAARARAHNGISPEPSSLPAAAEAPSPKPELRP